MADNVVDNLRLKELILVVNKNRPFYDEFKVFLSKHGYEGVWNFIVDDNEQRVAHVLHDYFDTDFVSSIYDGIVCIPVIIAESWTGDLNSLGCDNYIHIPVNPNQVERINPLLEAELEKLVALFSGLQ